MSNCLILENELLQDHFIEFREFGDYLNITNARYFELLRLHYSLEGFEISSIYWSDRTNRLIRSWLLGGSVEIIFETEEDKILWQMRYQ